MLAGIMGVFKHRNNPGMSAFSPSITMQYAGVIPSAVKLLVALTEGMSL